MQDLHQKLSQEAQDLLYALAYAQLERRNYGEALSLFQLLTFNEVGQPTYWMGLGMAYQGTKAYKDALRAFSKAANLGADNPHVHLKAAECYLALNQTCNALKALSCADQALKFRPEKPLQAQVNLLRSIWR